MREDAQLKPGATLDVQLYQGTLVLRKRQALMARNQDFQQRYLVAKEAGLGAPEAKQVYAMRQPAEELAARIQNDPSLTPEQRGQALGGIRQEIEKTIHTVPGEKGGDQFNRGGNNRWLDAINPQPIPQNTAAPRP